MENLYTLYIDTQKPNDLESLCNKIDEKTAVTRKYKNKIVFQFFYQRDIITLAVFAGGKNHQGFNEKFNLILKKSDTCPSINIEGQSVYFGDLEIHLQDDKWSDLKSWLLGETYSLVAFKPDLIDVSIGNGNGIGGKTIQYTIYPVKLIKDICIVPTGLNSTLITNPSPPHKGN